MYKNQIKRDTLIAEILDTTPLSVKYLMDKGIKCLACGEPIWGTLESEAKSKGFSNEEIDVFVNELNELKY